jgi:uncharacterized protein YraI
VRALCLTLVLASIAAASCTTIPSSGTATPFLITSTLPPTPAPPVASLPPPATSAPAAAPIPGTTSSRLNVRGDPSSASPPLGMIEPFSSVQIRGKDPSGNWYEIEYAQGKDGLGWVTAQYVTVQSQAAIPVVAGASESGPSGVITQQLNVRSGPGTDSNSVGTLNARDVVVLVGKDSGGLWLQIQYPAGPEGKGWVASGYVQADGLDQLPIVGQTGQVIGTETPTGIPPTAIPTSGIAATDDDSAQAPAADVVFSPEGAGSFIYSGDVSAPAGDAEDWIRFTPYGTRLSARLDCQGTAILRLELTHSGQMQTGQDLPACGTAGILTLSAGQPYLLRLFLNPGQGQQEYAHFTLTMDSLP